MYRSPLYREGDTEEEFSQRLLNQVEELLMFEGPHTIAAFCVESVTGTNGEQMVFVVDGDIFCNSNLVFEKVS